MKFPGKRKARHYFPVSERGRIPFHHDFYKSGNIFVLGICQLLVDVEAKVSLEFLSHFGLKKGESVVLGHQQVLELHNRLLQEKRIVGEFAGGAIGNTLHNYSILSDNESVLLGAIPRNINFGDYAYKYICNTTSLVDLSYLRPSDGPIGKAICLVTPDGDRTFGIARGCMDELDLASLPQELIGKASLLLVSAFLLRNEDSPIFNATIAAVKLAKEKGVPVVLSLGSSGLIASKREFYLDFVQKYVNVLAMNDDEARSFTLLEDPLLAGEKCLDMVDMTLITVGDKGLYLCAHVDAMAARKTKNNVYSKSLLNYNEYEFSRGMLRADCRDPIKIYTHLNPYMGGPGVIHNTNGAGDAALAALLHDMVANIYHRQIVPHSIKHDFRFLTYSSIAQISKYSNRVSYELLRQNSPRLLRGLPEKEDNLEEGYWEL